MKNTIVLIVMVMMMVTMSNIAFANVAENVIIHINGEVLEIPAGYGKAKIIDGRTRVPVRVVSENLGFDVDWDGRVIVSGLVDGVETEIILEENALYALVNGEKVLLDAPMYIDDSEGRSYVPLRFVSENLGKNVDWEFDGINHHVYVTDGVKTDDVANTETDMTSEAFIDLLSKHGNVSDENAVKNFKVGPNGFFYDDDDIRFGRTNMTLLRKDGQYMLTYYYYSDKEINLSSDVLKALLGSSKAEIVDSILSKLDNDLDSTYDAEIDGLNAVKLHGKSYDIDGLTVTYKVPADNSQVDLFIKY